LRRSTDFVATLRAGRRRAGGIATPLVVVHLAAPSDTGGPHAQAGFVVSRAVGGAVVRNQVRRRLRHLVAARLDAFPPGTRLVVRALPAAATASSAELGEALDGALAALTTSAVPASGRR
jgi:ribonuclease P protein component